MRRKIISILELTLVVLSVFAFSYFVSTNLPDVLENPSESKFIQFLTRPIIPVVSANPLLPSGCCKETISGAICQDMLLVDKNVCKTDLIGTGCGVVSECQRGCCYDSDSGICSLNSPRENCISNDGKWDASTTCEIPECQIGCCIMGDGASMMTTRECSRVSGELKLEKNFKPLDSRGSCDSYAELTDEGACLSQSDDFSKQKNCIFTTKANCNGENQEFKKGYLCTSKELGTNCALTEKTTCFNDKVYFIDSCENRANIYDSFKGKNQTYWEKVVLPSNSCSGPADFCGNCQYNEGSICAKYIFGTSLVKPQMGNNVCKNLNCVNGRKHGESWCVSDSTFPDESISNSVGSRSYVATCFEGEIRLDGCADFNQEICIENKDSSTKKSEAMCIINDWRSCIYANDADSYSKVESKCSSLPQCIMFNDIEGNEKYANLPGFKEIDNELQGRAGDVGKGMNEIMTYCVPRFTPGYQFWTSTSSASSGGRLTSSAGYGGSLSETNSLCGLGTFTCISHIETTSSMAGGSSSVDKENPECNWQAVDQTKQKVSLMMDGLNDRCRSLGSCGIQYNVQGELGRSGFEVNRIYIDKKGKSKEGYTTEGYNVSQSFLKNDLKKDQTGNIFGKVSNLEELTKWENGASMLSAFGSEAGSSGSMISGAFGGETNVGGGPSVAMGVGAVGSLAGLGMLATAPAKGAVAGVGYGIFTTFAFAAAAFMLGSFIGSMMARGQPPGEAAVTIAMWAGGVTAALALTAGIGAMSVGTGGGLMAAGAATAGASLGSFGSVVSALCAIPAICIVIAIIAIVYMLFTEGVDHEYYITEFKCEAWQPPLVGKCEECNNDVRPCSEYKCKSTGNNCQYFVENGEPGYCATLNDIWNAKIEPWKEILTPENEYANVSSFGFKIENKKNNEKAVNAWEPVAFGIITDKEAICKIDTNHSMKFEEMRYVMSSELNYATGKIDGKHHGIALSPHAIIGSSNENIATTLPMREGANEYYIICQNFAGLVNDAPFVVQIKQSDGPDLTAPLITRIAPENNAYLALNSTDLNLFMYLNEPAECRYSFESYNSGWENSENGAVSITQVPEQDISIEAYPDAVVENPNSMPMTCVTSPSMGFYGEWMCAAFITNYTANKKLYIECKDQPGLIESGMKRRNIVKKEYSANICETGLYINSIEPNGNVELNSNTSVELKIKTEGCINNGDAVCSFRFPYYGNIYSTMLITGNKTHIQPLTSLGQGTKDVDVVCEDIAGNKAEAHTSFTIFIDDKPPVISRIFIDSGSLVLNTDEDAECLSAINNESLGCDFGFENAIGQYSTKHTLKINGGDIFYIKCRDKYGNLPLSGCTQILRLSDLE